MNLNVHVGQGVRYRKPYGRGYITGLVSQVSDDSLIIFPAYTALHRFCYDDVGAVYDKHKDNVRLKDCPPPFSDLSDYMKGNVFVNASKEKCFKLSEAQFKEYNVQIIDGGKKISERDMQTVRHHPWPTQAQKEYGDMVVQKKPQRRRLPAVADVLDDMEKDSGMEY